MRQTKKTYLVVMTIARHHAAHDHNLIQFATSMGCQIEQSRMTVLGTEYTATLLLSGNWGAIAKFEAALPHFQQKHALKVLTHRTDLVKPEQPLLHYFVQAIAIDQPQHLEHITGFFSEHGLPIIDLASTTYTAQHTGTAMFSLNLTIEVPVENSIADLREQFMLFCDELNIDAILEADHQ